MLTQDEQSSSPNNSIFYIDNSDSYDPNKDSDTEAQKESFSHSTLTRFPPALRHQLAASKLRMVSINLSHNDLKTLTPLKPSLPLPLSGFHNLKSLNLSFNKLEILPKNLFGQNSLLEVIKIFF
jgi:Leucine-rich repeat (LRR) protein